MERNTIAKMLRLVAAIVEPTEMILFPGADETSCKIGHVMGGDNPDGGHILNLLDLLNYIADMVEE